mmetsp:Transcript_26187/g.86121  ORF Transcript_26187/g.86121 Transcript_26187/m.86121 type:complete len:2355 (-) Transcript_26187:1156-8220(-)
MVVNFGHVVFAQVRQLVSNLNKKNFKATSGELNQLLEVYGHDVHVFLFRSLINQLDLKNAKSITDQTKLQLLAQELGTVMTKPNFASVICQAFEGIHLTEELCNNLAKTLKLTFAQHLTFGLALCQSQDQSVHQKGTRIVQSKLPECTLTNLKLLNSAVLSTLLVVIETESSFVAKETQEVLSAIKSMSVQKDTDPSLLPILKGDQESDRIERDSEELNSTMLDSMLSTSDTELAEVMNDVGYSSCTSVETLVEIISNCTNVNEGSVANAICMMAKTLNGLQDSALPVTSAKMASDASADSEQGKENPSTWNIEVFTEGVRQANVGIKWNDVFKCLDTSLLNGVDDDGLKFIFTLHDVACRDTFPIETVLKPWRNSNAQFQLLKFLINGGPEIHKVLEAAPNKIKAIELSDGSRIFDAVWTSIDLVETLLRLSESEGYEKVAPLFNRPVMSCSEVLIFTLAQCKSTGGALYSRLLSRLISQFMVQSSSYRNEMLKALWTTNKNAFIHGMVHFCRNSDQQAAALLRILEVIQELGLLLEVLNSKQDRHFTIDLAVLAAQNTGLPFANWASKAGEVGGDEFALAAVSYLRSRVYGGDTMNAKPGPSVPMEYASALLQALQAGHFDTVATSEIRRLVQESQGRAVGKHGGSGGESNSGTGILSQAAQSQMPGEQGQAQGQPQGQGQPSALFAQDIEEEANSHFQRIYTSEMQIEGVVQMLKGFKASSNQREQEVFACMIHNLFDEYRFFPRYPERELLITGKLFGSLIQHQLVSSITLGIALRYVLEALRKPLRSNMFKFGMCALEQFKARLVEWPQYCHHILQIAHIRQSHEELIDYIQRALSSSGAARPTTPHEQGPVPSSQGLTSGTGQPQVSQAPSISNTQQSAAVAPNVVPGSMKQGMDFSQDYPQSTPVSVPSTSSVTQAQVNAYGAFNDQTSGGSSFAGFVQGFSQESNQTNFANLQNFVADINSGSNSSQEAAPTVDMRSAAVQNTLSVVSGAHAFGVTTNVDVLLQRANPVVQPDTAQQDKIHFIFNNLSNTNLEQKEKDLLATITDAHVPWLQQYVVVKRAAQESNYLSLYCQFVDRLDKKVSQFVKGVIRCTIDNIKILLGEDKVTSSVSLRSLLKNLGSWLGMLTLQKNKPILQRDLDLKQLVIDAYEKGRLIAVVPFIAKVLENVSNSRIFKPPNPWTMLILGLLAEIHPMTDLKLNVKFEVEVLCKNLNKDLKDIKPSCVLKNRTTVKEGNPDWNVRGADSGLGSIKPLPTVPDQRLLAAAAGISAASSQANVATSGGQGAAPGGSKDDLNLQGVPQSVDQSIQNLNISNYITINPSIAIFQQYPNLVSAVIQAVTQAIKEIVSPVVDRSVTIACITTRELVSKDFALEQDEQQLKAAAHMMVQNLAGSLALVTSKEPLRHTMCNQLRAILNKTNLFDSSLIEQAAQLVANDNLDLGCNIIEKAATEKAVRDIDVTLDLALLHRRKLGTPFHDALVQVQQWLPILPESLRPKAGPHQKRVYEDFMRLPRDRVAHQAATQPTATGATEPNLRGFAEGGNMPMQSNLPASGMHMPVQNQQTEHLRVALDKCMVCLTKAEEVVTRNPQLAATSLNSLPQVHEIQQLLMQSFAVITQSVVREEVAVAYGHKLFRRIYDNSKFGRCQLGVDWLCAGLVLIGDVTKRLPKELMNWLLHVDPDTKLNRELTVTLVQNRFLNLNSPEYVKEMVKAIETRGLAAMDCVMYTIQQCLLEKRIINTSDCARLLDALTKLAQSNRKPPESLLKLLEDARNIARGIPILPQGADAKGKSYDPRVVAGLLSASCKPKDTQDPPGLRDQISYTLDQWVVTIQTNDERSVLQSITLLLQQGWLKGDEVTDRFFRICIEICIDRCTAALSDPSIPPNVSYSQPDALAKLVLVLVRCYDDWSRSTTLSKNGMVNKFLAAYVRVLHNAQAERKYQLNQKPFHRLFLRLLLELTEAIGDSIVFALADVLHAVQPRLVPSFSFSWLELASHKSMMPKLLQSSNKKGWMPFQRLLVGLFRYLEPYLRSAELHEPIKVLYKGTLRVLLVLLHDFPEFLCEFHASFCDVIPPSCIQLRNLILSAFPRNMTLPDPFTPQLKVDLLPEIHKPPIILSNFTSILAQTGNLKSDLDNFLKGRGRDSFLQELPLTLLLTSPVEAAAAGTKYNVPLINSLVLYVAASAISQNGSVQGKTPSIGGASLELFVKLSRDLDTEGRYLFFNAIANQLRYPNSHTHYLSCVLLNLFQASQDKEIVREQVTRVLIERLIVNKPHPWGLLITFIELIKNSTYDIWRHDFVRSSKEIEQLFQSVARFCLPQQGGGSGGSQGTSNAPGLSDMPALRGQGASQ